MTKVNKDKEESVFRGNEVMMMLEQMSDGIAVIAEEQKGLREGQDKLRTELKEEIQGVRTELKEEIQEFRDEVNEKFDSVFEFLSSIEDELVDLRKEINILKEAKADDEKVIDLDKRVSILEEQFEMVKAN